jgi:hypothetical protein
MAKETELPMQAQGISPEDFSFGSQKGGVVMAGRAVYDHAPGLDDDSVWQWLMGLVDGELNQGRSTFPQGSPIREFARYLAALYDNGNAKGERLGVEVARAARREEKLFGPRGGEDQC